MDVKVSIRNSGRAWSSNRRYPVANTVLLHDPQRPASSLTGTRKEFVRLLRQGLEYPSKV